MTQQSEQLAKALGALKTAADHELRDNFYYMAAHKISELHEVAGVHRLDSMSGAKSALTFRAAIENARRSADEALADNRYYAFAHRLDALSFIAAPLLNGLAQKDARTSVDIPSAGTAKEAQVQRVNSAQPSASATDKSAVRSFDDLANASMRRLETVTRTINDGLPGAPATSEAPLLATRDSTDGASPRLRVNVEGNAGQERPLAQVATTRVTSESDKGRQCEESPAAPGLATATRGRGEGRGYAPEQAGEAASSTRVSGAAAKDDSTADSGGEKIGTAKNRDNAASATGGGIASLFGKLFGPGGR